jgi:hypothetical protein
LWRENVTPAKIARVALLAAAAGATNAWLCFAGIPVPVEDDPAIKWHVIPAGALHGGILALWPLVVAVGLGTWTALRSR